MTRQVLCATCAFFRKDVLCVKAAAVVYVVTAVNVTNKHYLQW